MFANENHAWTTAEDASSWTSLKKRAIFFPRQKCWQYSWPCNLFPVSKTKRSSARKNSASSVAWRQRVDVSRGSGFENNPWVVDKRKCEQQEGSNSFWGWNPRSPAPFLLPAPRCISKDLCQGAARTTWAGSGRISSRAVGSASSEQPRAEGRTRDFAPTGRSHGRGALRSPVRGRFPPPGPGLAGRAAAAAAWLAAPGGEPAPSRGGSADPAVWQPGGAAAASASPAAARRLQPCVSPPASDTITREAAGGIRACRGEKWPEALRWAGAAGGGCRCPPLPESSGAGREAPRSCRRGQRGRGRRVPVPPHPAVLCPQAGGDGGGHEQHAAESGGAGAHGRGPAHRRAAPVSGAFLPALPGVSSSPAGGGRGRFGRRRAKVSPRGLSLHRSTCPAFIAAPRSGPASSSDEDEGPQRRCEPGEGRRRTGGSAAAPPLPCVEQEAAGERLLRH